MHDVKTEFTYVVLCRAIESGTFTEVEERHVLLEPPRGNADGILESDTSASLL
jgi:hypothetical protein